MDRSTGMPASLIAFCFWCVWVGKGMSKCVSVCECLCAFNPY